MDPGVTFFRGTAPPQGKSGGEMKRLVNLIGMTVGGWLGWQLGILISFFAAFILGVVGTGLGLYASQRVSRRLLP